MDDFMMGENTLNMTPEVAGLQSVAMTTMSRKFLNCCFKNRHLSLRMLADEVNIGKDTVRKIVVEDLRKRKICSRFIPHSLTPEQKDQRIAACRDLIATADSDPDVFKKIVTGDETWCLPTIRPLNVNPLRGSEKPRHVRKNCDFRSLVWKTCWSVFIYFRMF